MPPFNINNNEGNKKATTILYAEYTDRSGFQIHIINNMTDPRCKNMSIVIYSFKKARITLSGRYFVHSNTVQIVGGLQ